MCRIGKIWLLFTIICVEAHLGNWILLLVYWFELKPELLIKFCVEFDGKCMTLL